MVDGQLSGLTTKPWQCCPYLLVVVRRDLQPMPVRVAKVHRTRLLMIDDGIGREWPVSHVAQVHLPGLTQERQEAFRVDSKGHEMKPSSGPGVLGLPFEKRQLRASVIAGNHEWPTRVIGPFSILRQDLKPEDALVPRRCRVSVRYEQLHMIDLPYSKGAHVSTAAGLWKLGMGRILSRPP